ncbi:MAG: prolipoprotein diacylglyceryl transferase family protein [Thermoleophilia bacterium]
MGSGSTAEGCHVAGLALALVMRLPARRLADIGGVGLGLGIAIYRVGCFLQGCCYGRPTDLPWGVRFPLPGVQRGHAR